MMDNDLISRIAAIDAVLAQPKLTRSIVLRVLTQVPDADAVKIGSCEGCYWKEIGRQQKCSCCRRNRYLKDCYCSYGERRKDHEVQSVR